MTRYGKSTFEVRVQRLNETPGSMKVDDASSAATYWREKITAMPWYDPEREMCVAVMLNTRLSPVGHTLVGIGTLNECTVHPRDVFRAAVAMAAYAVRAPNIESRRIGRFERPILPRGRFLQ